METVFLVCAILGGTLMICQFVMTLVGIGGDHEVGGDHSFDVHHDVGGDHAHADAGHDHGHGSAWFFGMLSFRALTAGFAFFGLAGLAANARYPEQSLITVVVALAAGLGAMFIAGWIMRSLYKLQAEGTLRIERAVGLTGTVYLTIPAEKAGAGKVTLSLQNRIVEYEAVTSQPMELPTGSKVVVVAIAGPGKVEVAPAA